MKNAGLNILLIDNKECDVAPIGKHLSSLGLIVEKVKTSEIGKQVLSKKDDFHAVITRATMPGKSGSELAGWAKRNKLKSPFYLLTERDWQLKDSMLNKYGITDMISDDSSIEEIHGKIVSRFALAS